MPFVQVSHCGNANTDTMHIANEIASICESEREFWAKVDKWYLCTIPSCHHDCDNCATREALYDGVCIEAHLTTADKDALRKEVRDCHHEVLAHGYVAGAHGAFCLTGLDVESISDAVGFDVSELQEAMEVVIGELTAINTSEALQGSWY